MPYTARQTLLDVPNAEHGLHRYWRSAFTEEISDELIDALVEGAATFSSPLSALIFFHVHGAATRPSSSETAFAARRQQWDFDAVGQWSDAASSDQHIAWVGFGHSGPVSSRICSVGSTSTTPPRTNVRRSFEPHSARTMLDCRRSRAFTIRRTYAVSTQTSPRSEGGSPALLGRARHCVYVEQGLGYALRFFDSPVCASTPTYRSNRLSKFR